MKEARSDRKVGAGLSIRFHLQCADDTRPEKYALTKKYGFARLKMSMANSR